MARKPGASDSLLAAVIEKLPPPGQPFTGEARANWLKMMAMAFDVAYGIAEDMPKFLSEFGGRGGGGMADARKPEPPAAVRQAHAGHNFYVAKDGTACNADGIPVLRDDVPADEMVFDYRPVTGDFRDLDGVVWADGARGTTGIAAGVSFCGPG